MEKIFIPRFRTIHQCLIEIKKIDSESTISEWFIRSLCKKELIEYYPSGNKSLVNFDNLLEYLGGGRKNEE